MVDVVAVIAVILSPTLVGGAVLGVGRLWQWRSAHIRAAVPTGPPIQRIAADVRRLQRQRRELLAGGSAPGRRVRIRALDAAYLDALRAACRALDVDPPGVGEMAPGSAPEMVRVESELLARGLDIGWSETR